MRASRGGDATVVGWLAANFWDLQPTGSGFLILAAKGETCLLNFATVYSRVGHP